jgi:sugar O-acyltransferase (sialic acid O-acetyltransferase NeuD family)
MAARSFVFWGGAGHARVLRDLIALLGDELCALFDNDAALVSPWSTVPIHHGAPGFAAWLAANDAAQFHAAVAIGGARGRERCRIATQLQAAGFALPPLLHPSAVRAASARLGPACQLLAAAVVGSDATLARGVIVNSAASVDHECELGEGVHVAPQATLCGCVSVGAGTLIGAGAVIVPRVRIGADVIVGAGSVVTRDLPDGVIAWGAPARVMRDNPAAAARG